MKSLVFTAAALALVVQSGNLSPRKLLDLARPLTSAEAAAVLQASRAALTGKTFRLSYTGRPGGLEVLMGRSGRPKIIRSAGVIVGGIVGGIGSGSGESTRPTETHFRMTVVHVTDYTGVPARPCGGGEVQGELVLEYKQGGSKEWTVAARRRDARDFGGPGPSPIFEMLQGAVRVTSDERGLVGRRRARALVAPWTPPAERSSSPPPVLTGDPIPNIAGEPVPDNAVQSLWIDVESMLPLRWEASRRGGLVYGYDFEYRRIDLRPPAGIHAPHCIP